MGQSVQETKCVQIVNTCREKKKQESHKTKEISFWVYDKIKYKSNMQLCLYMDDLETKITQPKMRKIKLRIAIEKQLTTWLPALFRIVISGQESNYKKYFPRLIMQTEGLAL